MMHERSSLPADMGEPDTDHPDGETPTSLFFPRMRRLMEVLGATSDAELAKALGISSQSVSSARKRRVMPSAWVIDVAQRLNASADYILFGHCVGNHPAQDSAREEDPGYKRINLGPQGPIGRAGLRESGADAYRVESTYDAGSVVLLPRVQPRLAPGGGVPERAVGHGGVAFQHVWLSRLGSIRHMAVLEMIGEHMRPTINHGDIVLFDGSQNEIIPGGIYVLAFDRDIVIKRVDRLPGRIVLLGDNPTATPAELDLTADQPPHVVGRVLWCGRTLA